MQTANFLQTLLIWAIPLLFAITVHEVAHGWVASKLGDKTAAMMGRLTLNPIKHIDLFGTIILPAILLFLGGFVFGWAKPVPVTWQNLKHPRRDMALVALAGPGANLLMALIWAVIARLGLEWQYSSGFATAMLWMGEAGISINLLLMLLNLIPIPPLDGSRVITSLLSPRLAWKYSRLEPYGFIILLALLVFGALKLILIPPLLILQTLINAMFGLI